MHTTHRFGSLFVAAHEAYARKVLGDAGLRPTRQRLAICSLLFSGDPRHVAVDDLHREAEAHGIAMSLATVYNTMRQFDEAGLVRRIAVPGERVMYDVNAGDHHHFYIADEDRIVDIPDKTVSLETLPEPPAGYVIDKVDVVVHLRRAEAPAVAGTNGEDPL